MAVGVVLDIIKAVTARGLLFSHGILCIYRVYRASSYLDLYWLLSIPLLMFLIEGVVMIIKRRGREYKWASPSFLLYLGSTVPAIWIMEFRRNFRTQTDGSVEETDFSEGEIGTNVFVSVLEQTMIYVLIIGRWLLPRGRKPDKMSRDDLSQLVVTYIFMALDITDLFSLLQLTEVKDDDGMFIAIFVVWTVSLLQFTIILTATNDSGSRYLFATETWSIILTVLLQDLPFLIIRLLVMFYLLVLTYNVLAFAIKNVLIMALLVYRLWVLRYRAVSANT